MKVGLRVDVDTFKGTRYGVPRLVEILKKHNLRASFFFSVGPDNMGKHLWRLLRPQFLWKMLRSRAVRLYGPEIILCGTIFPGPMIVEKNISVIQLCADQGHEIGVHAWDHQYWQSKCESMNIREIQNRMDKAVEVLTGAVGRAPVASAVAGFRCTEAMLLVKEKYGFKYNSDCIGRGIFNPVVGKKILHTPQIPFDIPTYDELIGTNGITNDNYNEALLKYFDNNTPHVLTIHAEVEGGICAGIFDLFLSQAQEKNIEFCPLGGLLPPRSAFLPIGRLIRQSRQGREGWVSGFEITDSGQEVV